MDLMKVGSGFGFAVVVFGGRRTFATPVILDCIKYPTGFGSADGTGKRSGWAIGNAPRDSYRQVNLLSQFFNSLLVGRTTANSSVYGRSRYEQLYQLTLMLHRCHVWENSSNIGPATFKFKAPNIERPPWWV